MLYAMMAASIVTVWITGIICSTLHLRNIFMVAVLQFLASLGVTYVIMQQVARTPVTADRVLLTSAAVSGGIVALVVIVRILINRSPKNQARPTQHYKRGTEQ